MADTTSDLASYLGASIASKTTISSCSHQKPKEKYHVKKGVSGCAQCFTQFGLPAGELIDSKDFCRQVMDRFIDALDNATYMPHEHIQKEKEYGIKWRTAFKTELQEQVQSLCKADAKVGVDPFVDLHAIVKREVLDACERFEKTETDQLGMMCQQLDKIEKVIHTVKCLLKQSDIDKFKDSKADCLKKLEEKQKNFASVMK